jgi:hypothetical protein
VEDDLLAGRSTSAGCQPNQGDKVDDARRFYAVICSNFTGRIRPNAIRNIGSAYAEKILSDLLK